VGRGKALHGARKLIGVRRLAGRLGMTMATNREPDRSVAKVPQPGLQVLTRPLAPVPDIQRQLPSRMMMILLQDQDDPPSRS